MGKTENDVRNILHDETLVGAFEYLAPVAKCSGMSAGEFMGYYGAGDITGLREGINKLKQNASCNIDSFTGTRIAQNRDISRVNELLSCRFVCVKQHERFGSLLCRSENFPARI